MEDLSYQPVPRTKGMKQLTTEKQLKGQKNESRILRKAMKMLVSYMVHNVLSMIQFDK